MAAEQQSSRSSSIISPASNQLGPGPHFQIIKIGDRPRFPKSFIPSTDVRRKRGLSRGLSPIFGNERYDANDTRWQNVIAERTTRLRSQFKKEGP
jgi:hypothetical protein